jgi:hypothetical protein
MQSNVQYTFDDFLHSFYFVETLKCFLAGAVYVGDKFETGLSSEVDDLSSKDPEMGPR